VLVADCDKLVAREGHAGRIFDFLLCMARSPETLMAVEMKSKSWGASTVCAQLQAGADFLASLVPEAAAARFFPLLLTQATASPMEYKRLGKCKIAFKGRRYGIILDRCGASLEELLRAHASSSA
jgi:hypothetical protein